MPLYDIVIAKTLVAQGEYELVTGSARRDSKNLQWESKDHAAIFNLLDIDRHFIRSPTGQTTEWGPLDCDQYRINVVELDRVEDYKPSSPDEPPIREARSKYEQSLECFVKFAIDPVNPSVAVVSIHQSR